MLNMLMRAAADVLVPAIGRAIIFIGEDAAPYFKTADGVVHPMAGIPAGGNPGEFIQKTSTGTQWAGAVDLATDQVVGGVKTFTSISYWNLSAGGRIIYGEPGGDMTGITMYRGDWANSQARRGDVRVRATDMLLGVGALANNAAPTNFVSIGPDYMRPTVPGVWSLGTSGNAWLNTYTAELTITGDAAAQGRSRTSLGAVGLTGNESVSGTKTFSQTSIHTLGMRMPGDTARLVMGDGSVENGSLRATTTNALVVAAGPGTAGSTGQIILRPNGNTATTGQVTILGTGAITFGGDAASKLATISSLGAVSDSGSQTISGNKTFTGASLFTGSITQRTGTIGGVEIQSPTGLPGIVGRNGDPADVNNQYRHDIHFGAGFVRMLASTAVGSTAPAGGWRMDANFYPVQSNTMSCGTPSNLWTQVCATNGAINTSDERLKTPLAPMSDAEEAAFLEINELPMKWQWLARVAEEGDSARWHAGPSVQAAVAVMDKHGLDAFAYSAFCYDAWLPQDEVWREWPAEAEEVVEWPAVPELWVDVPAEIDDEGEEITPARRELIRPAMPAGRAVLKEAVEAGRELVQPAVAGGDRYSFRVSELQAWILAAMSRKQRRVDAELAAVKDDLAAIKAALGL